MSLNDQILRATGGPTVNDGLRSWYVAGGASSNETLQDLEREWLLIVTVGGEETDTISDLWGKFLTQTGFNFGTLNDKLLRYWRSQ